MRPAPSLEPVPRYRVPPRAVAGVSNGSTCKPATADGIRYLTKMLSLSGLPKFFRRLMGLRA